MSTDSPDASAQPEDSIPEAYDYHLPKDLIAQEPLADRAAARLLVLRREDGRLFHRHVRDLPEILRPGDLLVVNDTRVVPARLTGRRVATGGRWEGLFLRTEPATVPGGDGRPRPVEDWVLLARSGGRPRPGERIELDGNEGSGPVVLELLGRGPGGVWRARPAADESADRLLARVGRVPLPAYIRGGTADPSDAERYQTVFAREAGSAAAPTAGLHFTVELLERLAERGVERARVTLHVGIDTFRPITATRIDDHPMHREWCECPPETAAAVAATRARGGRVVAVGTTAVRTLETAARATGTVAAWRGATDLFIRPGYTFAAVDCLVTNFHMPRTTLMVLVSAFASRGLVGRAYDEAIRARYRLLSYGDAMLIE